MAEKVNLELPASATIAQAEELLKNMRELFVLGCPVEVDASNTEKVDTAVMQLLVSMQKTLEKQNLSLSFSKTSTAFNNAVKALALESYFNLK
ncbi:STAS domain-containing protein [Catenovulum sp. SM1970]|uniref:STAS domain-containing protein n=1 Tax=Marinifaba aquimaris TaxID=2741323 RepID=UPI001573BD4F|nr:STAS domain-containing protein [Marinifaba aquimaris]NTS76518.1 STAS domain-containing protein [Marinifaba aquimaris]